MEINKVDLFKTEAADDTRKFRRFGVELRARVAVVGLEAAPIVGVVKDLSLTGLYFICSQRFAAGAAIRIEVICDGQRLLLDGTVRRCTRDRVVETAFATGVQFSSTDGVKAAIPTIARHIAARAAMSTKNQSTS